MELNWIDWSIVGLLLFFMIAVGIYTKKYTLSVADFLVANRCARRYLITICGGVAGSGAITIIAALEIYYEAGFTYAWWWMLIACVTTIVSLSGWVSYRLRQTRTLTLAQFVEIRYSKNLRIFMGIVGFFSGIINFGIFPAVASRFFIYFCGLPDTMFVFITVMVILIALALFFTFIGGQIAIMATDFIQGIFSNIMFIIIIIVVLFIFNWSQIFQALLTAPPEASMIHPFKTAKAGDFNMVFYLITSFFVFYTASAWQGTGGYNASALNAHEARMGKILNTWRMVPITTFKLVVAIGVYTLFRHPDFILGANTAQSLIDNVTDPYIKTQMTTTIALKTILPRGVLGGMVAAMLCAFIGNCDTYLHSWGSIFVQDVILPLRKKVLSPKEHIKLLRLSIFAVAVFIFFFSLLFHQTEYIIMFFKITGAIYLGGAGSVLIGGLYWKRGTVAAAWSAMIIGSILAVLAILVKQIHVDHPFTGLIMGYIVSQNGAILSFYAAMVAILVYIVISMLQKRQSFDLDKMLHRGIYAIENDKIKSSPVRGIKAIIGITNEFNRSDRILYYVTMGWTFSWVLIFILGTVYNLIFEVKTESWMLFWRYYLILHLVISVIVTIWFTICGIIDFRRMFAFLKSVKRNDLDDGTVVNHQNLGEIKK